MSRDHDESLKIDSELRAKIRALYRPIELIVKAEVSTTSKATAAGGDLELVERIVQAYRLAQHFVEDAGSFWSTHFGGRKQPVHVALINGSLAEVAAMLSDPAANDLLFGFDSPCSSDFGLSTKDDLLWQARDLYDRVIRLGEAIGAFRLHNPEQPLSQQPSPKSFDAAFDAIEGEVGTRITLPHIYARDAGVMTSRGLVTYRAIQSLYQAHLLATELRHSRGSSVVEIGAGLGRTAYFSTILGIKDYTIVDLPLTSVAQAYFLGRTIGPENIVLLGETHDAKVKIVPPDVFFDGNKRYDLALNVDSLTEMSHDTAIRYLEVISQRSPQFISINHEANAVSVRDIYWPRSEWNIRRSDYWMRKGYIQENIKFNI